MPWENKGGGGGPWGGGSGSGDGDGPWGRGGGGSGGPWSGGPGGGRKPPDFEDFIRKGQDRFKQMLPGGRRFGPTGILIALLALLLLWGLSGVYRVQTNQQGVVLRFGQWVDTTQPGLHWHWPHPIESVILPGVTDVHQIDIGFRMLGGDRRTGQSRSVPEESLMVTGDQNIIDIQFTVQWRIADAGLFLFRIREPEATVKIAAESAMREIIGRTNIHPALAEARGQVEVDARNLLQKTLDEYEAGIAITGLVLQQVQPPAPVIDAFNDVQRAIQDRDRLKKQAEAYERDVIPRARGEATRVTQGAEAYRERLIKEAEGEAQRFLQVYNAYKANPDVTRRRMYLETLQDILSSTDKVIMEGGAQNPLPYLPLPELRRGSGEGG
jgi:membrane protease subunit HflK